jgi:hypothetical protein
VPVPSVLLLIGKGSADQEHAGGARPSSGVGRAAVALTGSGGGARLRPGQAQQHVQAEGARGSGAGVDAGHEQRDVGARLAQHHHRGQDGQRDRPLDRQQVDAAGSRPRRQAPPCQHGQQADRGAKDGDSYPARLVQRLGAAMRGNNRRGGQSRHQSRADRAKLPHWPQYASPSLLEL